MSAWLSDDPVAESLQNSTAHLWLIQKVSRVKKKKESYFFSQTRKIKMRGGSEINWMMIKLSVLFSGFEFTRSPCFWEQQKFMGCCSYQITKPTLRRHFSTRDPHPCCTSRPFGSSTCYYTVLALPSLLHCGITPPGLHSSQHSIDLHTLDLHSRSQLSIISSSTHNENTSHYNCSGESPFDLSLNVILFVCYLIIFFLLPESFTVTEILWDHFSAHLLLWFWLFVYSNLLQC